MPSLSQTYRPDTFAVITGQQHITQTLCKEVASGKLAHAFLFCGPRGVGKTTTARVLAKALLCLEPKNGEPCEACSSCQAFEQNKHLDMIELDAATHTGVDNVREAIIEAVKYAPTLSKRKVYVLDEVHMFSASSWNALLKTLEEPPAHAFFILATTEWHKVPATIVSRCQRFEFRRIADQDLLDRVNDLAKCEGWTLDPAAAKLIVSRSEGCVRDAETLLGQLGALGEKTITLETASLVIPPSHLPLAAGLMRLWADQKHAEALTEAQRLFDEGIPMLPLFDDLIAITRSLLAMSGDQAWAERWKQGTEDEKAIASLNQAWSAPEIHDLALMLIERRKDAKGGLDPLFALQLAGSLVANGCLRHQARSMPFIPTQSTEPPIATKTAAPVVAPSASTEPEEPRYEEIPPLQEQIDVPVAPVEPAKTEKVVEQPVPKIDPANIDIGYIRARWLAIMNMVGEKNQSLLSILKLSRPDSLDQNVMYIRFQYPFHRDKILNEPKNRNALEEAIEQVLGKRFAIDGMLGGAAADAKSPTTVGNVDMVSALLQAFGGQVVE